MREALSSCLARQEYSVGGFHCPVKKKTQFKLLIKLFFSLHLRRRFLGSAECCNGHYSLTLLVFLQDI